MKADPPNNKKRKTTAKEQAIIGSVKRRRVEELSASSSQPSHGSQSDAVPASSPRQSIHREESSLFVEEESPREPSRPVKPVQNAAVEEEEAANEEEGDDGDTPEAQAHALIQENYGSGGGKRATESDDDAYRKERNDSALDIDDDDPDAPMMPRLFHQFAQLKEVVASVISLQAHVDELEIRRPNEPLFEDFDKLRRKIRMSYKALLDPATEEDAIEEQRIISRCITRLQRLVKGLDPDAADIPKPQRLSMNIYVFVVPDLLKILATASYNLLKRTKSDDDIISSDLSGLIDITRCITSLGSRAMKWKTKVDSTLALVKPVKNDIVAPLKKILREFERHRDRLEAEEEEEEKQLRRSQEVKRLRAEREFEKERIAKLTSKGDRLRTLYMWRANVETDLDRRLGRLAMPNLRRRDKTYPLDANGEPFEREAVFKPRSSIPHMDRPSAADEDEDWTEEELEALQEGLAEFTRKFLSLCEMSSSTTINIVQSDDEFFWKKFYKEYCHYRRNADGSRGGPLRDRNVAGILKEMARFRDYAIEDRGELPEWLLDIPDMDLCPLL